MPPFSRRGGQDHPQSPSTPALRDHAPALVGFAVIAVVLTYPIAFQMGSTLRDAGDPLLNTWILAWNSRSLAQGNLSGFFDANMFFPAPSTLAYSEFLLPQSLIAAPILLASGNPVLAYNVVLLAAFITAAFGAYMLGTYLNGRAAGFVAGLIFAFSPFMFDHLTHLQVLSAGGIPLAFLYLHKFFVDHRTRHLLLFSLFFVLQALANAYYAMYLTLFAGLYILVHVVQHRRYFEARFWGHMALHVSIVVLAIGPFFYRYLMLRRDFSVMVRRPVNPATGLSFLATPPISRLYGDATEAIHTPEAALFPGLCALVLATLGIVGGLALRGPLPHTGPGYVVPLYRALGWGLALCGGIVTAILSGLEIDTTLFSIPMRATSLRNPIIGIVLLALARLALKKRFGITTPATRTTDLRMIYAGMAAIALLLTIPGGPYRLLHSYVPGFDGMRAVTRIHIMFMLGVAILASYGVAGLIARIRGRRGLVLAGVLAVMIGVESLSVPVPLMAIPVNEKIPALHRWLASQEEDFAFVEYPIERRLQLWQVYFSAYHWKRQVTGASATMSPIYLALRHRQEPVPSPSTLDDFEMMGLRYLVVHDRPASEVTSEELEAALALLSDRLRPVAEFESYDGTILETIASGGQARVYELTRSEWRSPQLFRSPPTRPGSAIVRSDRSAWVVTATPNHELARFAVDGDVSTRWHSDLQQAGDAFQLDLGEQILLDGIVLDIAAVHEGSQPRGYRVEVSQDGLAWSTVAENPHYRLPLTELLRPRRRRVDIGFSTVTSRHIRIVQTGHDPTYPWSINEVSVTAPLDARPEAGGS